MTEPARDENFWDFSLRTYGTSGVPEACLALQDEEGADVNMILYCCWAGGRAGRLSGDTFSEALAFSKAWSAHVVQPLRSVRRWMKQTGCAETPVELEACMALRNKVKKIELSGEKLQQTALEALPLIDAGQGSLRAVAANLRRYFAHLDVSLVSDTSDRLTTIVSAAFPPAGEQDLQEFSDALSRQ